MGGAAAAVMAMKERQLVEAFEAAGAVTPAKGISEGDLRVDVSHIAWRRLRSRAVVRETTPGSGLYYLDKEVWIAVRRTRKRIVVLILLIAAMTSLAIFSGTSIFQAGQASAPSAR